MEEAYRELYQQFIHLRSLCMKQAAMLHQLTTALQKQQGASVPTADVSELMSIPVQCSKAMPVYPHEAPQPGPPAAQTPAEQCGFDRFSRNVGIFSDVLAEDMSKLRVDIPLQRKEGMKVDPKSPFLLSLDSLKSHGALSSESKHQKQSPTHEESTLPRRQMPVTDGPSPGGVGGRGDHFCPSGGVLMSDVALQSHVCEFCEAVFPGDTTTRGEFLRHLYTHVT
ncbi:uncharacterized protein LOC115389093 [Salarias fasciatus]|uniref:Uncharacterized LOC115389093 n=1 Tax=Salarias fasciatus TaxID=181472 RepID=A0A672IP10_SALFA|nr:uncharacterized protein LOC115389093 [Salarias fasciatus]XP_029948350.1 uncharacterized protein LOC115389093 [Salarias fasciatus]